MNLCSLGIAAVAASTIAACDPWMPPSPLVPTAAGTTAVETTDAGIAILDLGSGRVVEYPPDEASSLSPWTTYGTTLFGGRVTAARERSLVAYDLVAHALAWQVPIHGYVVELAAGDAGVAALISAGGLGAPHIVLFDRASGVRRWSIDAQGTAQVRGDLVLVTRGSLEARDVATGALR